jgi:HAD superfamily hydrolase (TIGR01484 family)
MPAAFVIADHNEFIYRELSLKCHKATKRLKQVPLNRQADAADREGGRSHSKSRPEIPKYIAPNILPESDKPGAEICLLDSELNFYGDYRQFLNPFPTIKQAKSLLNEELKKLGQVREAWQVKEIMTNVFLLSCALINAVDDYVHGKNYRLPRRALKIPLARLGSNTLKIFQNSVILLRRSRVSAVRLWEQEWQTHFGNFLEAFVCEKPPQREALAVTAHSLAALLRKPLPAELEAQYIRIPSAFRKQDLTPLDVLAMGRKFTTRFPDYSQPILLVGLRTAGTYFAPLLLAFLKSEGYHAVEMMTIRPSQELSTSERANFVRCARARYLPVILDDPPFTGTTIAQGVEHLRKTGFQSGTLVIMFPIRSVSRDWKAQVEASAFLNETIISLEPEEWHKYRILAPDLVEQRLREYFVNNDVSNATIIANSEAEELNARLLPSSLGNERYRLKRIYAVRLQMRSGRTEIRYVLAKSVGCGLFGYSAFLAGSQLADFVPPLLGLRDGVLYTEWLPQTETANVAAFGRSQLIERAAEYISARVGRLGLASDQTPGLGLDSQHEGFKILGKALCKAYGSATAAKLMSRRVRQRLSRQICPVPTFIDGKMSLGEWIFSSSGPLKTDFEHHGFGKQEVNLTDPAFDLADAVLQLGLTHSEEEELIGRYEERTGDTGIKDRLFFGKLMAGCWSMASSLESLLRYPQPLSAEFNQQYVRAWDFLTRESARFCGKLSQRPQSPRWHSPLVVLDIDGVLDRRIFGFPTTTAAGVQALRCLHSHGFAVAVNTARSVREVEEYCASYGFVGGVAEYGSYVFDAVGNRGKHLLSGEALEQLDELRLALRKLPGIFLNDHYEHSIRVYAYERGGTVPLPTAMVPELLTRLNLHQLRAHQTTIDTTIVAKDADKGRGLSALLTWAEQPQLETIAVGDSEPDLAMFRVANRSFAPGQFGRSDLVKGNGGQIARHRFQRGLLAIVHSVVHPDGGRCESCPPIELERGTHDELFVDLLETADKNSLLLLLRAVLHPSAFQVLVKS